MEVAQYIRHLRGQARAPEGRRMASEEGRNLPFPRVGKKSYGYHIRQVDYFFDKARAIYTAEEFDGASLTSRNVREVTFDASRGGYEPPAVDAALDRLEDVLAQRERDATIAEYGEDVWLAQIGHLSHLLRSRLQRPDGERFRRSRRRNARSYSVADVDALCSQLLDYFDQEKPLSVDAVRRAVFRSTRGPAGYEEQQVDGFLDRVVELMAAVD